MAYITHYLLGETLQPLYISDSPVLKHLIKQWHPTKNGELTPSNTKAGSGRSIWWVCEVDSQHEWQTTPLARSSQNQGCPFCLNRKIISGQNDLATTHPDLLSEWHPTLNVDISPYEVSASTNQKAYWICPVGSDHVWEAIINSRKKGSSCPYCANRKVLAGFNDLASNQDYSEIASQWHPTLNLPLQPTEVSAFAGKKVWWLCSSKHAWEAIIANRTKKGSGCPVCYKTKPTKNLDTVANSPLAGEWSKENQKPSSEVTLGSGYLAIWECSIESTHIWEATVANRVRGSGCPFCFGKKAVSGVTDLGSSPLYKEIAEQWHPDNTISVNEVTVASRMNAKWICSQGHEWNAKVYSRTLSGTGCPECVGRRVQVGKRLTVADFPELAKQWHEDNILSVDAVSFQSAKKVFWICGTNANHVWEAPPVSRSLNGKDCPACAGRKVIKGVNDLASHISFKEISKQWHPDNKFSPEEVTYSSNRLAKWQCSVKESHTWEAVISSRTKSINPTGCPSCAMANKSSQGEEELYQVLLQLGFTPERSVWNAIPSREVDLYIPSKKFAIEFNGLYWHSEAIRPDKDYHSKKLQACTAKGIYLYNVWEDDWRDNKEIVIRGLAHRLGATDKLKDVLPNIPEFWYEKVGGRATTPSTVPHSEAKEFLDAHHIQGSVPGAHYLGLYDKQTRLRAVLVLSTTTREGEYRIDRYASAGVVSGGFTKLLKYGESVLPVKSWLTFADLGISDGALYESNGFKLDSVLKPDYSYLVKAKRVHKFNYRIQKFKKDKSLSYQEGLTEKELASLNGLHRIWDFGKNRYVKEVVR